MERFTIDLADYLRTLLLAANGIEREAILGVNRDRIPEDVRTGFDRYQIEHANEVVLQLYRDLRYSINQRFDLELAISRLISLGNLVPPQRLVTEVRNLQQELLHAGAYRERSNDVAQEDEPVHFDEPPRTEGITFETVREIAGRFRTQRISVAALLSRVRFWRLTDDVLVIAFVDDFGASALAPDREEVQHVAMSVLGRETLSIRICTLGEIGEQAGRERTEENTPDRSDEQDDAVEMVRRVFGGEIVEGNA